MTANQLLIKANRHLATLRSVHSYEQDTLYDPATGQRVTTVVEQTMSQQGCLTIENLPGLGAMTVLNIGAHIWTQPSDEFWKGMGFTGSQLASVSGKWLAMPDADNPYTQGVAPCSIRFFAGGGRYHTGWTKGRVTRGHGVAELAVNRRTNKIRETVEVSVSTEPVPLSDVLTDSTKHVRVALYFGNFNAPIVLTAPPASDVLTTLPTPPGTGATGPQARAVSAVVAETLRSLRVDGLVAG